MANQYRSYENKIFEIAELFNILSKLIQEENIKLEDVSLILTFKEDDIDDDKKIEWNELKDLTSFENKSLIIFFDGYDLKSIFLSNLYNDEIISIAIKSNSINKLKYIFTFMENELKLKKINKNKRTKKTKNNIQESKGIQTLLKGHKKNYGPIRLFKEDLEKIIELFDENFSYYEIKIDNSYKIQDKPSFDRVINKINKDSTNQFSISGSNDQYGLDLYLDLDKTSAFLKVKNEKDVSMAVFYQIDLILSTKEKKIIKYFTSDLTIGKYIFVMIFFYSISLNFTLILGINILFSFIALAFALITLLIIELLFFYRMSLIYLYDSKEKETFFKKNKEIIEIISIVIGMLSACITIIAYLV